MDDLNESHDPKKNYLFVNSIWSMGEARRGVVGGRRHHGSHECRARYARLAGVELVDHVFGLGVSGTARHFFGKLPYPVTSP